MASHIIRFHSEATKYVRITDNGFLATRGFSILGGLFENYTHKVCCVMQFTFIEPDVDDTMFYLEVI